jgi:hypothetical protein
MRTRHRQGKLLAAGRKRANESVPNTVCISGQTLTAVWVCLGSPAN